MITERLPLEITSEIFILCAASISPMTYTREGIDNVFDVSIPLGLASVCRLWRSIAHSTPALWTSFRIYIHSKNFPERVHQAQQWLSRSGQLPLSIQIRTPRLALHRDRRGVPCVELIDLLNGYSHRWRCLDISVPPDLLPPSLFSKATTILKAVTLLAALTPRPLYNFRPFYAWLLGIHWNNITHFTGRYMFVAQALEILRLSPQLQEYSLIELYEDEDDNPPPSSLIHLTQLETLLVDSREGALEDFLNNINVPSLTTFKFNGSDCQSLSCNTVVMFLNRSGCFLKSFSLKNTCMTEEEIIDLLFTLPYLETLTLGPTSSFDISRWVTDRMLGIFAETAEIPAHLDGAFLPNLQSLEYMGCVTFSWKCVPLIFGDRRAKERNSADGPITKQRPLDCLKMELYTRGSDEDLHDVVSRMVPLAIEGYGIQIVGRSKDKQGEMWKVRYMTSIKPECFEI